MTALAIAVADSETLALESITRDPELICRARGVNKRTVKEYAEAMKAGAAFPPVVVFKDSKGAWLADGFHRCAGAELAGLSEVAADLREGSRKDALLYAAKANGEHGLRRSNADKRRAVLLVLGAFPKWSDRKIGEACGVTHPFVAAVRRVVTVTTSGGEASEGADTDRTYARLEKALDRLLAEWPPERRGELVAKLKEVLEP